MDKNIILKILDQRLVCNEVIDGVNSLLKRLMHRPENAEQYNSKEIKQMLSNPALTWIIAIDPAARKIVGMASIYFIIDPSKKEGQINSVVTDKEYLRKGIAKAMVKKLIEIAKDKKLPYTYRKIKRIDLTSRQDRKSANSLYRQLGFKKIERNHYRLYLTTPANQ